MTKYKITLKKNDKESIIYYDSDLNKDDLRLHLNKVKYINVANITFNVAAYDSYTIE